MDRYTTWTLMIAAVLSISTIILSSYAIAQTKRLYLIFPLSIACLNLIIPVVASLTVILPRRIFNRFNAPFTLLASASTFVPFIFLILSFVYGLPSDLLSCTSERRWQYFWHTHNTAIRMIQDRLQCCGFNSLHDRAWPFPNRDTDARACETTLHYTINCADIWMRQESNVAAMVGFASFLNWILLVFLVSSRRGLASLHHVDARRERLLVGNAAEQPMITEPAYEDQPQR